MKKAKKTINCAAIILGFLFYSQFSSAQVLSENYYNDTSYGTLDRIVDKIEVEDGIIIAGIDWHEGVNQPVILKLNFVGDVVWSTLNENRFQYDCNLFEIQLFKDGFIYGFSRSQSIVWGENRKMWKVNPVDGHVEYITNFYDGTNKRIDLAEYNDSLYVAIYANEGASADDVHIAYMHKMTGDTVQTKFLESSNWTTTITKYNVAVDDAKNIYYTIDSTLTKLNRGDFDMTLWIRSYLYLPYSMEDIWELYMDKHDQLFILGRENTVPTGVPSVIRINKETGYEMWTVSLPMAPSWLSDFTDDHDFIYTSYRKAISGLENIGMRVVKIRKSDGNLEWNVGHQTTILGSGLIDDSESAMGLDVNCSGDIYATGFYNHDTHNGAWSIQKLSGIDGALMYEHTITEDSVTVDGNSSGICVSVIRDTAYILGHLETQTNPGSFNILAYFTSLDPVSGDVMQRKFISAGYQLVSKTLNIVNHNDTMFVLKQQGEVVVVEAYDSGNSLIWQNILTDQNVLLGGQIAVDGNYVFVSTQVNLSNGITPYNNGQCEKIKMHRMNRLNGGLLFTASSMMGGTSCKLLELESGPLAYLLYEKNGQLIYRNWNPSLGFSPEVFIETANSNLSFEGNLNILNNYNNDTLLVIGSNSLFWINKLTNSITPVIPYGNPRSHFDHLFDGSLLYIVGKDDLNLQSMTKIDLANEVLIWDNVYTNGEINRIGMDFNGQLFVAGVADTTMIAHKVAPTDGTIVWAYAEDPTIYANCKSLDLVINKFKGHISIVGSNTLPNGDEDGIVTLLSFLGDTLYTNLFENQSLLAPLSQVRVTNVGYDSTTWIGGAHNRYEDLKEGFVSRLNYNLDTCGIYQSTLDILSCDSYVTPLGNLLTLNGTYIETIPALNGCDSTITINFSLQSSTGIDVQNSCTELVWIDGNTYTASNSTATHTLLNSAGCDSIVQLNFIYSPVLGNDVQTACETFVWIDGNAYNSSTSSPTWMLTTSGGCDSIVTLNLSINSANAGISSIDDSTLNATVAGAQYQWLDCDANFAMINGETNQTFIASVNGNYAVEVTENGCTDTSTCMVLNALSINPLEIFGWSVSPNPASGHVLINLSVSYSNISIKLYDVLGRLIVEKNDTNNSQVVLDFKESAGVYWLDITADEKRARVQIINQ